MTDDPTSDLPDCVKFEKTTLYGTYELTARRTDDGRGWVADVVYDTRVPYLTIEYPTWPIPTSHVAELAEEREYDTPED